MNYRHGFHAGNHADVFKHAALTFILERLLEKAAPFAVLDTHAGIGVYDLDADAAQRTREFEEGIGRLPPPGLASAPAYSALVAEMNPDGLASYPGSPEIARRFLRDDDRLMSCELHPEDVQTLKALYRKDPRVSVHHRDGYEAIGALLPPPERRGLALIDPPFEQTDEAARLADALAMGLKRWSTGIFMAWYPVKDGQIGGLLSRAATAARFPKALRAEFLPFAGEDRALIGSGLLIINAPWKLDERLSALCAELNVRLGAPGARWSVDWLTAS